MPTDVMMPQMGESIFEGTITKWLKRAGDPVEKDEPLFEISTDKVDAEIPSPVAGILSEIRAAEGATVQVNTVVAVIQDAGNSSAPASTPETEEPAASTAPEPASATPDGPSSSKNIRSSPQGRITKDDILRHLSELEAKSAPPASPATPEAPPPTKPPPATVPPAKQSHETVTEAASPLPGTLVPLTKMRAIIAQRMAESAQIGRAHV